MSPRFLKLKKQTRAGRTNRVPDSQILSEVFISLLPPDGRTVNRSTVAVWFKQFFVIGSSLGHTGLHPHKTAACQLCCHFSMDADSCEVTIKMERNQGNQTDGRKECILQLNESLESILAEELLHKEEAHETQEAYRVSMRNAYARAKYNQLSGAFVTLLQQAVDGCANLNVAIEEFCGLAAIFIFIFSSDYQQDKLWPAWHCSPQPGLTYFLSKFTEYVQLICAESCGETDGESRFGRNRA